ncbi:Protein ELYS [Cyphomyrmex costatus]|uniref:Protein ELYS n=1 Tax=Cyphomyrmex costatus TaxID=456900 RepID=A0A151IMR8_9HYME|nr:Protein ELYS [Cyphomyrmex costatus]
MKELEEVNCEIRRIVKLQFPVSNWLRNLEYSQSANLQDYDNVSECRGEFLHDATYAWLSYGCHLVVFNVKIGETVSSWVFRGIVKSVSQFPTQSGDFPLLLVGIDNCASKLKDSSGLLCIFDCTTSRVLRAIRMPCGIEQVCVVAGGAEWEEFNDKRPDNLLSEMDGMACVVLRNLHHIMIDLRRTVWDMDDLSIIMDETSPAEIHFPSAKQIIDRCQFIREKHTAYNLLNNRIEKHIGFNREDFEASPLIGESLTTAIISSTKIGCLISGCLGRVIIWQNDGSIGWISTPIDENMIVTHLALLEPTDDPRPFYYLWVVFQDELSNAPPILRMYAMLFERKYCDREINLYFNLENDPSLKFESELNEGDKVISLCTVERESNSEQTESTVRRGEDNLLLIATSDRIFLFDLNQWYKEQMPHTISECQNPNSILATYRIRSDIQNEEDSQIISFAYIPHSLQEFSSNGPNSSEELFYPNSLSLEWVELNSTKLTFWMTRGIQTDLLREIAMTGPVVLIQPFETFHRCLSVGLVPFNSEFSFSSDQNAQREMLLSLCLEQRWSSFLIKCATEWSDGSASYLYPTFLNWGIQRASTIKIIADRLCIPLFDQSGSSIGETDVKTLRFCSQQLECLSNIVAKLPSTAIDLMKQRKTLKRVSLYFQVLLWFYDVGLLPEMQDLEEEEQAAMAATITKTVEQEEEGEEEKNTLSISLALRVPYPYAKLLVLYKEKRAQLLKNNGSNGENEENLFIDELITRECSMLKAQWEREGGITMHGCYPPPSLQSLLRSYLTDCHQTEVNEINCRHQITIYLLMDLAMLLQRSYPAVKQLIKYPSAFMMSPSLIKLTQAFWLLDHENYQEFLDTMTGQLICDSDIKDWHHRFILRTLVRNNQHKLALLYLRVRKPPLSSIEEQGMAMSLSVEHGLVQSAFHRRPPCHYEQLLTSFFQACRKYNRLDEVLHLVLDSEEEEVFVKFLEENKMEDLRLLYYLQRCRYTEVIGGYPIRQYQPNVIKDVQSTSFIMLSAYEMTLPDITKRFSMNATTMNSDADLKARYSRPMSHCKSHDKLRNIYETVITKARETYLRGEKSQIPFVSAPCTSLKLNSHGINMNCVLFPTLMHKIRGKRTVDQIYEEDDADDMSNNIKRRKLSDEIISPSKRVSEESRETFDTPLVKRKSNVSINKDRVLETPQSILKIRQLVKSSTSPTVTSQAKENTDGLSEKERKVSRQIRFNINQSKKTLMYEEENEKEERRQKEKEQDDNEINVPLSSNEMSNDAFFSPNASNVPEYCESAILSDSSSASGKIHCYARPRPSLRRSALLQSSVETSQEFCMDKASGSSINLSTANPMTFEKMNEQPFISGTPRNRSSLLSTSIYSTSILSSDSSVDISYLTKTSDNTNNLYEIKEDVNVLSESEKLVHVEQFGCGGSGLDLAKQEDSLDMVAESNNLQNEHNNERIDRESSSSLQNYELPTLFESEKVPESIISDESDEELLTLRNDEDSDEHEETFESLSTILEDTQMPLDSHQMPASRLSEEYSMTKPNGLQESVQIMGDVDLTDDESANSRVVTGITPVVSDKVDNNKKDTHLMSIIHSEHTLYDMSNITDDESDSNAREAEEPKVQNDRYSNLQRSYVTQNVELEKNSESNNHDQSISKSEKNQAEMMDVSSVHMTRSRRASSLAKDISAQQVEPEKVTRLRRSSSMMKDSLNSPIDCSSQKIDFEILSRPKRANLAAKEIRMDSPSGKLRGRRASSLAKDILMSSVMSLDENCEPQSGNSDAQSSTRRDRRCTSVTKEIPQVITKDSDSESVKDEQPVRRSTRLASFARKVLQADAPTLRGRSLARSESATSLIKLVSDDEEGENTNKKSLRRTRKSSVSSDMDGTTISRSLRSSMRDKECSKDIKTNRKRGSSVPKEIMTLSIGSQRRRSNSIIKEVIAEVAEPPEESKRFGNSSAKDTEKITGRLTTNTRIRSASVLSVPEELEEILSPSMRETRSTRKKALQNNARAKRASSADMTHTEMKRRVKNVDTSITVLTQVSPIAEDLAEGDEKVDIETMQDTPAPKRRTASTTMIKESKKDIVKPRRGRPRKISVDQESSNLFSFSLPEETDDVPLEKDIGEVPNYVFSPPQTRFNKNISSKQRRIKISSSISSPYQEEQRPASQQSRNIKSGRCARLVKNSFGSRFRTRFIVSKKSKNRTN